MYRKREYSYRDELRDNIEASLQCPTVAQLLGTSSSQPLWWNLTKNTGQPVKLYRQRRRPFHRENYGINDLMHPVPLNWRHSQPVVQTPRYYKPTTLKKRPSRLCLPVACKLDPTYRTSCSRKKPSSCDVSMLDKDWQRDNSLRRSTSVELEAVSSDLDSLLVKYETMFDSRSNTNSWTTPKSPDYTDASIAPPLPRPRIHTTIRDKQMRRLPSSSPNSLCNQSELADKGESPSESSHLEGMLNDLVNKGFLPSITEEQTRSLQDMYSQLHDETAQAKQREDSVELRDSKSFIVSLIDNAVSRELSSTNTKQDSKTTDGYEEFVHLDVGDAINIVKSESSHKLNTQLCMDITRALTDKLINTTSKNNFLRAPEEPAYVKQLKQLRWDHLKHIQREVQRLEELERFLDSCSSNHSL